MGKGRSASFGRERTHRCNRCNRCNMTHRTHRRQDRQRKKRKRWDRKTADGARLLGSNCTVGSVRFAGFLSMLYYYITFLDILLYYITRIFTT